MLMHTNRLSQVCPTSLPNMPKHELQQKRPGFRLKYLLQEEACYWKLFPSLVYTTKTFMVCVLDTCHTPLHILSARVPWSLCPASHGCKSDSVSPVPPSHTSCFPSQGFSYARCNTPRGILALPHCNPEVRGSIMPWAHH